jgi:hypothetical protein
MEELNKGELLVLKSAIEKAFEAAEDAIVSEGMRCGKGNMSKRQSDNYARVADLKSAYKKLFGEEYVAKEIPHE